MVVFPERIKRRVHLEKYLSVCRLGTARLQVVNQSLTDLAGQRQSQWRACLRLRDFYGRLRPTQVIQFECANIPSTQSQAACQQEDGVISLPFCRTAIDRTQKPDDEFLIPHRSNRCISGNTDFRQLCTEIFLQNPTHGEEPEKRTYIRYNSPNRYWPQVISTGHELGQIRRLNLVQCPCFPGMEKI